MPNHQRHFLPYLWVDQLGAEMGMGRQGQGQGSPVDAMSRSII